MRVYVETYGCAQNQGEAHALERLAESRGHRLVGHPGNADLGVLVTCGVVGSTEARMIRRWRALCGTVPKMVVTGCLVPLRASLFDGPDRARTVMIPTRDQGKLFDRPDVVSQLPDRLPGPAPLSVAAPVGPESDPGPSGASAIVAEVVLAQGCTSACAYCFSRLARGHISSVPPGRVVEEVRAAHKRGAREIRLTSLDTAAWGAERPEGDRLPKLLDAVNGISGDFQVRVGMMSPQTLAPFAAEYFAALDRPRFFSFLHLPVQSGSDTVLGAMHRGYRASDAAEIVRRGRRRMPDLAFATDVIVGYPGETEDDFRATLGFLETYEPEIVNVTRFSARPFTPAARLAPVDASVVKERSRAAARLRLRVARRRLEGWIGRSADARVVEVDGHGNRMARLPNYLPVVLSDARGARLGERLGVRVVGARTTYLLGRAAGAVL